MRFTDLFLKKLFPVFICKGATGRQTQKSTKVKLKTINP